MKGWRFWQRSLPTPAEQETPAPDPELHRADTRLERTLAQLAELAEAARKRGH